MTNALQLNFSRLFLNELTSASAVSASSLVASRTDPGSEMLPKLASNLLHLNLQRAAVVQTQASQFRSVLQFQPSYPHSPLPHTPPQPNSILSNQNTPSSSGNSSSSGHSKNHNAGSRFYQGYTGPGRAVTQANNITAFDSGLTFEEEFIEDDVAVLHMGRHPSRDTISILPMKQARSRAGFQRRRNSLALGNIGPGRRERAHTFGILHAVQAHVRANHAFAAPSRPSPLSQEPAANEIPTVDGERDHSTFADAGRSAFLSDLPPSLLNPSSDIPLPPPSPTSSLSSIDGLSPSSPRPATSPAAFAWQARLSEARLSKDLNRITQVIAELRSSADPTLVHRANFNFALEALYDSYTTGQPIVNSLELYNYMVGNKIVPNLRTYTVLIKTLCLRDRAIANAIASNYSSSSKYPLSPQLIESLSKENNLDSALMLFHTAIASQNVAFDPSTCNELLRSCVLRQNTEAAIRVFSHLENNLNQGVPASSYAHFMAVFNAMRDLNASEQVFSDFKATASQSTSSQLGDVKPWDQMIEAYFLAGKSEKAIELVEQMLEGKEAWIAKPQESTYTAIILGFIGSDDIASALSWFNQLVTLSSSKSSGVSQFLPSVSCYLSLLNALYERDLVDDYIRVFEKFAAQAFRKDQKPFAAHRYTFIELVRRNSRDRVPGDAQVNSWLESLAAVFTPGVAPATILEGNNLSQRSIDYTDLEEATALMVSHARFDLASSLIQQVAASFELPARGNFDLVADQRTAFSAMFDRFTASLRCDKQLEERITLQQLLDMSSVKIAGALAAKPLLSRASDVFVEVYRRERDEGNMRGMVSDEHWPLLINAFSHHLHTFPEFFDEFATFMGDFSSVVISPSNVLDAHDRENLLNALLSGEFDQSVAIQILQPFGSTLVNAYTETQAASMSPPSIPFLPPNTEVRVDIGLTRSIDEWTRRHATVTALDSFVKFEAALNDGYYPTADCIARLVIGLARSGGNFDQIKKLYAAAQAVLATLESDRQWQAQAWFQVENAMVSACAMFGDLPSANLHRSRIIDQGGAPSADSYASLIVASKESTDDAAVASSLFRESQDLGVVPNAYLYNTVISKLSRARRADDALELFGQMKRNGIYPTSVTYGALIGACARVGDETSALYLFEEMHTQRNYKPRVPPFNTMIQLYVNVKPDREKALSFYQRMLASGVRPTAHTYKLLLDAYGTIEPVDCSAMETVFQTMASDHNIVVTGAHWASLINSWGCVTQDLNRAISIFESIPSHPSTARAANRVPDALTYEALINVLVNHHRMDLVSHYVQRLKESNIHMTAYVANVLIRGYAASSDLESARAVFESLADPPSGYAALNNHAAHEAESPIIVPAEAPVYREPSTWEAMVRAELGAGERDRAQALLERMESRHYPEGVVHRIRGILGGDAYSIYTPDSASSYAESVSS